MPMLQEGSKTDLGDAPVETAPPERQRRQMLIALGLLLAALVVVLVKDRQFLIPAAAPVADDSAEPAEAAESPVEATPGASASHDSPAAPRAPKAKSHSAAAVTTSTVTLPVTAGPSITASNRAALPPLQVEVVAGDQRRPVATINPSMKVDMQSGVPAIPPGPVLSSVPGPSTNAVAEASRPATNAGERVRLSADTAQMVERPVEPSYPVLAKQMKVQGSVVLQALIGREGTIQDLRVLSGPAILSTAAMDAVKQWRFRPYFQAGQPVETEARITVNFTISTN